MEVNFFPQRICIQKQLRGYPEQQPVYCRSDGLVVQENDRSVLLGSLMKTMSDFSIPIKMTELQAGS